VYKRQEFKSEIDIQIAEKMLHFPLLGEQIDGNWTLRLTQELNMTTDSHLFKNARGPGRLPLYEGKMIHQFTHQFAKPRYWLDEAEARSALLGRNEDEGQLLDYQRYRLAFRDVARNTDERTMIATVLPRMVFAGNTAILSYEPKDSATLLYVVGVLNSFAVDGCIRQKVTAHCNMFYVYQLPIPRLSHDHDVFGSISRRVAKLICTTPEFDDLAKEVGLGTHKAGATAPYERARLRAELDGMVAHLYGLTEDEFAHILGTFPLVPDPVKVSARNAYRDVDKGLLK